MRLRPPSTVEQFQEALRASCEQSGDHPRSVEVSPEEWRELCDDVAKELNRAPLYAAASICLMRPRGMVTVTQRETDA